MINNISLGIYLKETCLLLNEMNERNWKT